MRRRNLGDSPLWFRRVVLVILSPVVAALALWNAFVAGCVEAMYELDAAAETVVAIWKGRK
jgi:hypothetical protein